MSKKKITPKVIFKMNFVQASATGSEFSGYLEYMDRPEAFKLEVHPDDALYKNYLEYMSNEEKSDGLFDFLNDNMTDELKEEQKSLFGRSQEKGCSLYMGIISFDNSFLVENEIMDEKTGELNLTELKKITRAGMFSFLDESHLDPNNVYWCGAIHTNTDNIHVHLSAIEIEKVNRRFDKVDAEAFKKLKSTIAHKIQTDGKSKEISNLYRNEIIPDFKDNLEQNAYVIDEILERIPANYLKLPYGKKEFAQYREAVNQAVDKIIQSNPELKMQFDKFNKMLDGEEEKYRGWYGDGEKHLWENYKSNRLNDFYLRAGNALLKNINETKTDKRYSEYSNEKRLHKKLKGKAKIKSFVALKNAKSNYHQASLLCMNRFIKEQMKHLKQLQKEFERDQEQKEKEIENSYGY